MNHTEFFCNNVLNIPCIYEMVKTIKVPIGTQSVTVSVGSMASGHVFRAKALLPRKGI